MHTRVMWWVIVGGAAMIPMFVWPGAKERFRVPKEALFRAEAIILLALPLIALVLRRGLPEIRWRDKPAALTLAILGWTLLITPFSTNRLLSVQASITVLCAAVIFLATYVLAPGHNTSAIVAVAIPATVNSIFVILQELKIWNPFVFDDLYQGHLRSTALVGNPNDVGSFLVAPALMAFAAAFADRGKRILYGLAALLFSAGVIFSQTMTALGALLAGIVVLVIAYSPRRAIAGVAILAIGAAVAIAAYSPIRQRLQHVVRLVEQRDFNQLLTYRVPAFLTAYEMFKDRPVAGVGPGAFSWHYLGYLIELPSRYPATTIEMPSSEQFGEVHNDHLQVLAEAGLPGYLLLLASLALLASTWRASNPFARTLGPALAAAWFVLALAQFPLQIAAPRMMFLHLAAVTLAWRADADR